LFALATITGTILFLRWAWDKTRKHRPGKWLYTGVLWLGTLALAVATLAQVSGFANLAERLKVSFLEVAVKRCSDHPEPNDPEIGRVDSAGRERVGL
jgi:hypothetical protein